MKEMWTDIVADLGQDMDKRAKRTHMDTLGNEQIKEAHERGCDSVCHGHVAA